MAAYIVELASGQAGSKKADFFVVSAASSTDAKAMCKSRYSGVADEAWDSATVTTIADVTGATDNALTGFRFEIDIHDTAGALAESVAYTATNTNDTIDLVAAQLVTALNATASIANAAYNSGTQALTVATGSGGDDLGDHTVTLRVMPPVLTDASGVQENRDTNIAGFMASQVHEGVSTDPLTITFAADSFVLPKIYATALKRY